MALNLFLQFKLRLTPFVRNSIHPRASPWYSALRVNKIIGRGNRAPTIANIIAYFKYQTTKQINESKNTPGKKIWQRDYHAPLIRNDKSLNKIREYITNNLSQWDYDEYNIKNYKVTVQAPCPEPVEGCLNPTE